MKNTPSLEDIRHAVKMHSTLVQDLKDAVVLLKIRKLDKSELNIIKQFEETLSQAERK